MSASATQAAPQDDLGPQGADTQGNCQVLQYIINVGADFVRLLHEQALAQATQQATALAQQAPASAQHIAAHAPQTTDTPPASAPVPAPPPAPDALIRIAAAFDQSARAVRRCIALAQSLDNPKQQQATRNPAPNRTTTRKRILRAVEDAIQRPPDNPECDDPEVLLSDFRERMDAPDLDADISSRPVEDIIKDILRDLGLAALPGSRPWKRRTSADIAELNARAAAPSSPTRSANRPPGPEPQDGQPTAAQNGPDPEPAQHEAGQPEPSHSATAARAPVRPGDVLPKDPAEAVAFILHHHARTDVRWRPPPSD